LLAGTCLTFLEDVMTATITIRDESAMRKVLNRITLELPERTVTVRDLIRARVSQEVERYNRAAADYRHALVQPSPDEAALNAPPGTRPRRLVDAEKQIALALDAFQRNGFFILVDDLQLETLDDLVHADDTGEVTFVKLTPLVGG
jgi:hypothetical protein